MNISAGFGISLAIVLTTSHAAALDRRMIGAWSQSASDCAATFERRGGEMRYRRPVDEFKSALIVKDTRILTTVGQCTILKSTFNKNVGKIGLSCNNTIGYFDRVVTMTIQDDGSLLYGFPGNDALDVKFERCRF